MKNNYLAVVVWEVSCSISFKKNLDRLHRCNLEKRIQNIRESTETNVQVCWFPSLCPLIVMKTLKSQMCVCVWVTSDCSAADLSSSHKLQPPFVWKHGSHQAVLAAMLHVLISLRSFCIWEKSDLMGLCRSCLLIYFFHSGLELLCEDFGLYLCWDLHIALSNHPFMIMA